MIYILQTDNAFYFATGNHGNIDLGFWRFTNQYLVSKFNHGLLHIFIVYQYLFCFYNMFPEAIYFPWCQQGPIPLFVGIPVFNDLCLRIIGYNVHHLRIKKLAYFFAHQVVNTLHIHFGHQAFLNAVNYGQFCITLIGFFQQSVGFIKKPCIFQRYAHTVGKRFKQTYICIAESIFLIGILQAYITRYTVSYHQRYIKH